MPQGVFLLFLKWMHELHFIPAQAFLGTGVDRKSALRLLFLNRGIRGRFLVRRSEVKAMCTALETAARVPEMLFEYVVEGVRLASRDFRECEGRRGRRDWGKERTRQMPHLLWRFSKAEAARWFSAAKSLCGFWIFSLALLPLRRQLSDQDAGIAREIPRPRYRAADRLSRGQ